MKTKRLPPPLAALAALLLLLPGTAPADDGAAPILMTPGVFALAGDAYAEDHRGAEDKPLSQFDGACRIFDRDGFRVAFNESEVTLLHVPEKATIRELADFLYHEPFSKDILTRLRNGSPLTDGDLDMLDLVYEAQIEALKATVSLGYQALHFRACLNSTEAAARQKDAEFPAPTLLSRSIRNFYDLPTVEYHQLMTWGTNIADRAMDDSFRQVVTSSESKAARQMKWPALNERYYLFPHKYRESPRIHVKEKQVNRNVRIENWRNLHLDVRQQIRCLLSLYEFTRIWTEKAPPTNFKKIFIDHMTRLDLDKAPDKPCAQ